MFHWFQDPDNIDSDGDGLPNSIDPDDDNDGIPDAEDSDADGDGKMDGHGKPLYLLSSQEISTKVT